MQRVVSSTFADIGLSDDDVQYVTDAELNLVFVNASWHKFADANRSVRVAHGWHASLLDNFKGSERSRWQVIYESLLDGRASQHIEPFLCPSPRERRPFLLHIRRYLDPVTGFLYLVHISVRVADAGVDPPLQGRQVCAQALDSQLCAAGYLAPLDPVGGDLLWHRSLSTGGSELVIADAMGHGIAAARLASRIVEVLTTLADAGASVSQMVGQLNSGLVDSTIQNEPEAVPRARFATGLYLRVDPSQREVTLCSFGHTGPLFCRAGRIDVTPGLPVGIAPGKDALPWAEQRLRFDDCGDRFLAFTDGVTEQFNLAGEMFGSGRLAHAFRQTQQLPLPQMLDTIREELDAFRGSALVKDDRALLTVAGRA